MRSEEGELRQRPQGATFSGRAVEAACELGSAPIHFTHSCLPAQRAGEGQGRGSQLTWTVRCSSAGCCGRDATISSPTTRCAAPIAGLRRPISKCLMHDPIRPLHSCPPPVNSQCAPACAAIGGLVARHASPRSPLLPQRTSSRAGAAAAPPPARHAPGRLARQNGRSCAPPRLRQPAANTGVARPPLAGRPEAARHPLAGTPPGEGTLIADRAGPWGPRASTAAPTPPPARGSCVLGRPPGAPTPSGSLLMPNSAPHAGPRPPRSTEPPPPCRPGPPLACWGPAPPPPSPNSTRWGSRAPGKAGGWA